MEEYIAQTEQKILDKLLHPDTVASRIYSKGMIALREYESVMSKQGRLERNQELVNIVRHRQEYKVTNL